ncbi:hypothetical protein X777_13467 [Ooceraea biroi]|uniref:Uncharacterized protein n=1 Tax=Ooceraea biroi TaxID=2015173 RepID=A0A026WX12_OOCBI|nr:hypothetical protein X777_13467 [Ooceraea biroi]
MKTLQLEREAMQRQFETASVDRENAIQENRKLQDDLAAMTCEVRNMQRELETSHAECYDLKRQLQTYVSEVRRAEELLNRKIPSLIVLASNIAQRLHFKSSISNLTQSVANVETQLRQQIEQRHRAEADLMAVRDLCVKLDQQKDKLMEQLGDKDTMKAHYEAQLSRLKAEQTIVQDQMSRDRVTVERLETLLDQARQESINAQATNQELQNEISRLKQKVSELQNKLLSESAELRQYQTQTAEYSKQISELRRQVTNERFDRARKEEESRRNAEESTIPREQKSLQEQATPPRADIRSSKRDSNAESTTCTSRQVEWLKKSYTAIPRHKCVRNSGQVGSTSHDNRTMLFSLECRCSSSFRKGIPSAKFVPCPSMLPAQRKSADDSD